MYITFSCGASNTDKQFDFPRKTIPAAQRFLEDPLVADLDYCHNHIFKNSFLSYDKSTSCGQNTI